MKIFSDEQIRLLAATGLPEGCEKTLSGYRDLNGNPCGPDALRMLTPLPTPDLVSTRQTPVADFVCSQRATPGAECLIAPRQDVVLVQSAEIVQNGQDVSMSYSAAEYEDYFLCVVDMYPQVSFNEIIANGVVPTEMQRRAFYRTLYLTYTVGITSNGRSYPVRTPALLEDVATNPYSDCCDGGGKICINCRIPRRLATLEINIAPLPGPSHPSWPLWVLDVSFQGVIRLSGCPCECGPSNKSCGCH